MSDKKILVIAVLLLCCTSVFAQRNNYVLQNSRSSYGFSLFSGINTFGAKNLTLKRQVGTRNSFGLSYLNNAGKNSFESGLTYSHQSIRYNEEYSSDSISKFGLKMTSIGIPFSLKYKFSQKLNKF